MNLFTVLFDIASLTTDVATTYLGPIVILITIALSLKAVIDRSWTKLFGLLGIAIVVLGIIYGGANFLPKLGNAASDAADTAAN